MEATRFEQSLHAVATKPYRQLVSERMSGSSAAELQQAVDTTIARSPERLQRHMPDFLKAAGEKFLQSRLFWESSTCREALANILELAAEVIDDEEVWICHKRPFEDGGALAGHFFELSTWYFAARAAGDDDQRRLMGLKRGWLR